MNADFEIEYNSDIIFIPLNTFPSSLKKTAFYKNIYKTYEKKNTKFPLPLDIYNNEMNFSMLHDMFNSLIEIKKMIPGGKISHSNYDFILRNKTSIIHYFPKLKTSFETFGFIGEVEILINTPEKDIIEGIVVNNYKELLIYCLRNKLFDVTPTKVFHTASEHYNIEILEYIYKNYKKEINFNSEANETNLLSLSLSII
jgi:hypothetical protein